MFGQIGGFKRFLKIDSETAVHLLKMDFNVVENTAKISTTNSGNSSSCPEELAMSGKVSDFNKAIFP